MQNKKTKKNLELARKKKGELQQKIAGEKRQMDDPAELKRLEAELARIEAEIKTLQEE